MNERITAEDYSDLAGEYTKLKAANDQLTQEKYTDMQGYNSAQEDNLIKWQLDLKEDFDRIGHRLKGDIETVDGEGTIRWEEAKQDELKPFNEFGVQLIMNILSFYLNRNTILSNYSEETIDWKVFDFGNELADLIFNRYEEMGMDTKKKIKMYPMIIKELVDTVHSAYLRAYHGGERESLRTARMVTQNQPLMQGIGMGMPMNQSNARLKKKHWYNPVSWTG